MPPRTAHRISSTAPCTPPLWLPIGSPPPPPLAPDADGGPDAPPSAAPDSDRVRFSMGTASARLAASGTSVSLCASVMPHPGCDAACTTTGGAVLEAAAILPTPVPTPAPPAPAPAPAPRGPLWASSSTSDASHDADSRACVWACPLPASPPPPPPPPSLTLPPPCAGRFADPSPPLSPGTAVAVTSDDEAADMAAVAVLERSAVGRAGDLPCAAEACDIPVEATLLLAACAAASLPPTGSERPGAPLPRLARLLLLRTRGTPTPTFTPTPTPTTPLAR
mmetsp:Transcript_29351/g.95806  ORF Transcript_29351/g.95806 Transcript_29351/m.95806 type:complete len:279 (+) Transcript_29351:327-1163(+)